RGAENCRTLRARWVAAGFPIAGVLVLTSSGRSRHLRNRTDPETTYVKARHPHTRRLHPHVGLSTREATDRAPSRAGRRRSGRPVAAICHGPQLLIEADAVRGRRDLERPGGRRGWQPDHVEKAR